MLGCLASEAFQSELSPRSSIWPGLNAQACHISQYRHTSHAVLHLLLAVVQQLGVNLQAGRAGACHKVRFQSVLISLQGAIVPSLPLLQAEEAAGAGAAGARGGR